MRPTISALLAIPFVALAAPRPALGEGVVVVKTSGNDVTITGDAAGNVLQVSESAGEIVVFSTGGTDIIGGDTGINAGDLNNVIIKSKGGDDFVAVGFIAIGGKLKLITGDGDDDVFYEDVLVQGQVLVKTGTGADSIRDFGGVAFSGPTKYLTGSGDDELFLGDSQIDFADLDVRFGSGDDLLDINAVNVIFSGGADVAIDGNSGVDTISIEAGTLSSGLNGFERIEVN